MRLLCDVMLGKLTTYLRMCGHDTAYALDREGTGDVGIEDDDALLSLAREEDRRLVTRDTALGARTDDAILISTTEIEEQLRELYTAGVDLSLDLPERCSTCNGRVERVEAGETPDHAPSIDEQRVWRCQACDQYYWKGSHWDDVRERLARM